MLAKFRELLREVALYLRENPGAATLIAGWVVVALARVGLHVTMDQLTALMAVLIPLIVGVHAGARRARRRAKGNV